jgi:hypothetical protein
LSKEKTAMATCQDVKNAAKRVYPSWMNVGCFYLSPPVRMMRKVGDGLSGGAWLLDPKEETVRLVGQAGTFRVADFLIAPVQGRIKDEEISDEVWTELEELLNRVSNERKEDDDGPGSMPTGNAKAARDMLDKLWMERRK